MVRTFGALLILMVTVVMQDRACIDIFTSQLGRVGSDREREENKIFTVRGQMETPEESTV